MRVKLLWNLWPNLVATIQRLWPAPQRPADQRLIEVIAVALRRVDQVDAEFRGVGEEPIHLNLGEGAAPDSPPNCQVPRPTTEIFSPVRPNLRTSWLRLRSGQRRQPVAERIERLDLRSARPDCPGYSSANSVQIMLSAGAPTVMAAPQRRFVDVAQLAGKAALRTLRTSQ